MTFRFNFKDKTVLVTGATRGIGAAIAEDLRICGANLILTGTDKKQIDHLNKTCKSARMNNIDYVQVDFSDEKSTENFLSFIRNLKRLDVCINNAGANIIKPINTNTAIDFDKLNKINLKTPYFISAEAYTLMEKKGYGRIVNISSIWSIKSKSYRSLYSTTKAGLVGMTKAMAIEMADKGVLVNAVSPGFTLTELTKKSLSQKEMDSLSNDIPLKRFATTEEISKLVMFLSSELNTYITGQNIVIDGGFTIV